MSTIVKITGAGVRVTGPVEAIDEARAVQRNMPEQRRRSRFFKKQQKLLAETLVCALCTLILFWSQEPTGTLLFLLALILKLVYVIDAFQEFS